MALANPNRNPPACDFPNCNKRFSRKQDKKRHQNEMHENERFTCPYLDLCPRRYRGNKRKSRFRKHMIDVHGEDPNVVTLAVLDYSSSSPSSSRSNNFIADENMIQDIRDPVHEKIFDGFQPQPPLHNNSTSTNNSYNFTTIPNSQRSWSQYFHSQNDVTSSSEVYSSTERIPLPMTVNHYDIYEEMHPKTNATQLQSHETGQSGMFYNYSSNQMAQYQIIEDDEVEDEELEYP